MGAMTYEEAVEVVNACVQNGTYLILGEVQSEKPPSLKGYTLSQMIEANRIVREANRALTGPGPHTIRMHCDDRILAALYTATHFQGCDPRDVQPVCLLPDGRAVVVLDLRDELAAKAAP